VASELTKETFLLYDRNLTLGLVFEDTRYRPMAADERQAELTPCDHAYLKQRHYVACTTPCGLTQTTEALAEGWERLADLAWMNQMQK